LSCTDISICARTQLLPVWQKTFLKVMRVWHNSVRPSNLRWCSFPHFYLLRVPLTPLLSPLRQRLLIVKQHGGSLPKSPEPRIPTSNIGWFPGGIQFKVLCRLDQMMPRASQRALAKDLDISCWHDQFLLPGFGGKGLSQDAELQPEQEHTVLAGQRGRKVQADGGVSEVGGFAECEMLLVKVEELRSEYRG